MEEKKAYSVPSYGDELEVVVGDDIERDRSANLSQQAMHKLGLKDGDYITIFGAWSTDVRAYAGPGEGYTINIDSEVRRRLPVETGVEVTIRKKIWEGLR